jgi:AMP-polyphosphate phosphotransferase
MFETAELGRTMAKKEFEEQSEALRTELLKMQRDLAGADFPILIVIGGLDGAGKGDVLNRLFEWMDARGLVSHATDEPTQDERERPGYWRFWMALPQRGRIGIYHSGWYFSPIERRVADDLDDDAFGAALRRVNAFEKNLVDHGALIIKLWLHVSKRAQKKRLEKLSESRETRWRVTKNDWKRHEQYDAFRRVAERALRETSTGDAPWTVIESSDPRYRDATLAAHVLKRARQKLANPPGPTAGVPAPTNLPDPVTILDSLDLSQKVKKGYAKELGRRQGRLNALARKVSRKRRGVIMVFEGWDAAGKGGAIRRVTRALDARQYQVIPISAPSDEERAHHYLWRFWRQLPRLGKFTIYDRSWYGRVLVERVEGFTNEANYMRAYKEINDFEEQLVDHGLVVLKFWLHISSEEQLRRFRQRESEPWKQYKIGPEDYRNRAKSNAYEVAANEMIGRTSTEYAPWTLIEAEDKHFARLEVLGEACRQIESAL